MGSRKWGFVLIVVISVFISIYSFPVSANATLDYEAELQLGHQLFFDPRLSGNNKMSCATCHKPELAFTDGLPLARGRDGLILKRHTPTLLHLADQSFFFWDGRVTTLHEQVLFPIRDPFEMNQDLDELVDELNRVPGYVEQFKKTYGTSITLQGISQAIAAFERTFITRSSPFDEHLFGNKTALSPSAQRGLELFQGKASCAFCHQGFNFTDSGFHNIGVPPHPDQKGKLRGKSKIPPDQDVGRYAVTGRPEDRGAFKTPTLRNIAQTAPYMHNGTFKTLEEVMEFYDKGGGRNANLDMQMKPLGLTKREKKDLIEFMKALTGQLPDIKKPLLP